jgi:hypothetical protein
LRAERAGVEIVAVSPDPTSAARSSRRDCASATGSSFTAMVCETARLTALPTSLPNSPPVETKGELVQVGLEVLVTDAVVGAAKPGLEIAKDAVDVR